MPHRDEPARVDRPVVRRAATAGRAAAAVPVGAREAAVLALQRQAGNRATRRAVAAARGGGGGAAAVPVIGPVPTAIQPGGDLPATEGGGVQPLGTTRPSGSSPPTFHVRRTAIVNGQFEGVVEHTEAGSVRIDARYPAPGVYPMGAGEGGRLRKALIDDAVSALIGAGEQEHSNDFHLAYHSVYDRVATAINALAERPAKRGANVRDVSRQWRQELRDALPAPLRAPVEDISPTAPWNNMVARLNGLSNQRDRSHWHDMRAGFASPNDRRRAHVPDDVELIRIVPGGEIGVHGSQERIDAAAPDLHAPPSGGH